MCATGSSGWARCPSTPSPNTAASRASRTQSVLLASTSSAGESDTWTAVSPVARAMLASTGFRSRKRLEMWIAITPLGDRCAAYRAMASRVMRCTGMESLEKASTASTS